MIDDHSDYARPMRIGLINELHGAPADPSTPTWASTRDRALAAEAAGFDSFVYEDAMRYPAEEQEIGVWESTAIAGALAAATSVIEFGPSVINAPYRSPAVVASSAQTLNEISGGRYILGVGAGNTSDYDQFGFAAEPRFSRFAEWIEILHGLVRGETVTYAGEYFTTDGAHLPLAGPGSVPIVIAGGGPKMLGLVARFADEWNWWTYNETPAEAGERLGPLLDTLSAHCEDAGRDPASLKRSLDVYSVVAPGHTVEDADGATTGSPDEIASTLLAIGALGFGEVRCNVLPQTTDAIESMTDVVRLVHETDA